MLTIQHSIIKNDSIVVSTSYRIMSNVGCVLVTGIYYGILVKNVDVTLGIRFILSRLFNLYSFDSLFVCFFDLPVGYSEFWNYLQLFSTPCETHFMGWRLSPIPGPIGSSLANSSPAVIQEALSQPRPS